MMEIKTLKDMSLYFQMLLGLILVTLGVPVRPIMYVAALYCVGLLLFCRNEKTELCYLFCWLGISNIFNLSVGSISIFTILELLFCLKRVILKRRLAVSFFVPYFIFLAYLLFGAGSNLKDFVRIAMVPLTLYLIMDQLDYDCLNSISISYIIGIIYGSIVGLFIDYIPHMREYMSYKLVNVGYSSTGFITTFRFAGLWGDANYYSVHLILILTIFAVWFQRKSIKSALFYIALVVVSLFGGLSGSKSFIFALIVAIILIISTFIKRRPFQAMVLLVSALIFGYLVLSGYIDAFSRVMYRINQIFLGNDTLTTGRIDIWKSYFELFKTDNLLLLFGSGLERGFPLRYAHNTYLDFVVLLGIVGGSLYTAVLIKAITAPLGHKINGYVVGAVMLLGMYFFLSMFYSLDFPFELAIAFGYLMISKDDANGNRLVNDEDHVLV